MAWAAYRSKYNAERKTERKLTFTKEILDNTVKRIMEGESQRSVAKSLNVNESTLRTRLKKSNVPLSLGRFERTFPEAMEKQLVARLNDQHRIFYGLTRKQVLALAFELAEVNKLNHRFNKTTRLAGGKWFVDFCLRNNFSLQMPGKVAANRASGFNQEDVNLFYENLKVMFEKYHFQPGRIYNMDESGISNVPSKMEKVISPTGAKLVSKIVAANEGKTVTVVCCACPTGFPVPPAIIFPGKRHHPHLYIGAPVGSLELYSDSGFITPELFVKWLKHFATYTKPTKDDPVLLILDNHASHRSFIALDYCEDNHIKLISLPPHTSHKLLPLKRGFFGPLKTDYSIQCSNFGVGVNTKNEVKSIRIENVSTLFNQSYQQKATPAIAKSSFQCTGIYPYNPQIWSDDYFAPATVSENPLEAVDADVENQTISPDPDQQFLSTPIALPLQDFDSSAEVNHEQLLSPSTSETTEMADYVSPRTVWPPTKRVDPAPKRGRPKIRSGIHTCSLFKRKRLEEEAKKLEKLTKSEPAIPTSVSGIKQNAPKNACFKKWLLGVNDEQLAEKSVDDPDSVPSSNSKQTVGKIKRWFLDP